MTREDCDNAATKGAAALIRALAPVCREHGIRRIKVGDVEIEFGGTAVDPKAIQEFQRAFDQGMPTEEDLLHYSEPGYVPSWNREPPPETPKTARGRAR